MHDLLDTTEAASYLHLSPGHMAQMRYRGVGPAYLKPSAKTVRYRREDLDAWFAKALVEPEA